MKENNLSAFDVLTLSGITAATPEAVAGLFGLPSTDEQRSASWWLTTAAELEGQARQGVLAAVQKDPLSFFPHANAEMVELLITNDWTSARVLMLEEKGEVPFHAGEQAQGSALVQATERSAGSVIVPLTLRLEIRLIQ